MMTVANANANTSRPREAQPFLIIGQSFMRNPVRKESVRKYIYTRPFRVLRIRGLGSSEYATPSPPTTYNNSEHYWDLL